MERTVKTIIMSALCLIMLPALSYCQNVDVDTLVSQFNNATDVQRPGIEDEYRYSKIEASGIIQDIVDWDTFDERADTAGRYYRVITKPQTTVDGLSYTISIFYKDKANVDQLDRGQEIAVSGTFLRIIDEIGSFAIWVYTGELTQEDKVMLELV